MELEAGAVLPSLAGYTVLLPAVSVGNVGQLAVDVVLATLQPALVGQLHHDALIPCCGSDPLDAASTRLTTAMQLYVNEAAQLAVLQLRSGLLPGQGGAFLADLLAWCAASGPPARLVMLSSSHLHERTERQLTGSPLRYLASPALALASLNTEAFTRLEVRDQFPGLHREETPEVRTKYEIPGKYQIKPWSPPRRCSSLAAAWPSGSWPPARRGTCRALCSSSSAPRATTRRTRCRSHLSPHLATWPVSTPGT
jgi:hypothetical protein